MKRMITLLLAVLLLPMNASSESDAPFPLFEASFLQGWLCRSWTKERFVQELNDMKAAGFRALILQSAVDKADQQTQALFPSDSGASHALEYALQAAEETGMQVFIGLVSDERWWDYGWSAPDQDFTEWLAVNTQDQVDTLRAITDRYGEQYGAQIAGFYYPNEIWNVPADCSDAYAAFYAEQIAAVRAALTERFPEKPLLLSPFYNITLGEPEAYAVFLAGTVSAAGLRKQDIIALQDGAGRDYDAETIRLWNDAVCKACGNTVTVWVNNETFNPELKAISADILRTDYAATGAAQRHILFSWNHYYHGTEAENGFRSLLRNMPGDLNDDSRSDREDAACLLQWLSGSNTRPANWGAGDADGNGTLSAADLSLIKQLLMAAEPPEL